MSRKLRPAVNIVSDIGSLAFDLHQHDEGQIAAAVELLRTVNPEMFDWLVRVLASSSGARPPAPQREQA